MIIEDYVSFETAKMLKEKGFNAELHMYWGFYPTRPSEGYIVRCPEDKEVDNTCSLGFSPDDFECIAPTLQMAMKWLREVHKLYITIEYFNDVQSFKWRVYPTANESKHTDFKHYFNYDEACEAAIKYCLENLI